MKQFNNRLSADPLSKSDLQFSYSDTDEHGLSTVDGGCSGTHQIDRDNLYQVLYFVNQFAQLHPDLGEAVTVALRAERLLKTIVPENITVANEIASWLVQSWHQYSSI